MINGPQEWRRVLTLFSVGKFGQFEPKKYPNKIAFYILCKYSMHHTFRKLKNPCIYKYIHVQYICL